jgi:hypothetical protein
MTTDTGVTFREDESLKSFVSRLALSNFFSSLREFCYLTDIRLYSLISGEEEEQNRLLAMVKVDQQMIQQRVIRNSRLERLNRSSFGGLRYCACCVDDDIRTGTGRREARPYVRMHWELSFVRSCPLHGVLLRTVITPSNEPWDYSNRLELERSDPRFHEAPVRVQYTSFEHYVTERFWGRNTHTLWLDELPLHVAGLLCEWVGATILFGREFKSKHLSGAQWHQAAAAGFDVVGRGREAFVDFLKSLHDIFFETKHHCGARKIYGRIYERLAHEHKDKGFDEVKAVIAETAVNHLPFGASYELFGLPVERKWHSLHTLSSTFSFHEATLRKLLQSVGWLEKNGSKTSANRILFEADKAEKFVREIREGLKPAEARTYLNATRTLWDTLVRENHITRGAEIDYGAHNLTTLYLRADLDGLLERLRAGVCAPHDPCAGRVTMPVAIKKANCSFSDILRLILDGKLQQAAIDPGATGMEAIVLDVEEIRELTRLVDHGGLGAVEASEVLGLQPKVVEQLTKAGFITAEIAVNPQNRCPQTIYRQEELDRFSNEFVSLFGYASRLGVHFMKAKKDLVSAGVPVAITTDAVSATFYRWADIRAAGPRLADLGIAFAFQ